MSDIKKTELFMVDFEKERNAGTYFMAQPCMEACAHLGYFTKTKTVYLGDSLLSADKLTGQENNFMIFRDECPRVYFNGVAQSKEIYRNNTWRIFEIDKKEEAREEFKVHFPENPVEKIKTFLKR